MTITLSEKAMANAERRAREWGFADAAEYLEDHLADDIGTENDDDIDPEVLIALQESLDDEKVNPPIPLGEAFRRLAEKHNLKWPP